MIKLLNIIILIISLIKYIKPAETDCVTAGGKTGDDCKGKKTFVNMEEWSFIYEEDEAYMCCFYKGKIGNNDYEGCFPFFEDYIINNKVNDLLDDMEKGNWELALGIPNNEPIIDCSSEKYKFFIINKIFLFFVFLLLHNSYFLMMK